ncbi:MAG: signal peptidase I, partial [Candidatus Edwardsbacteria bacterium]|nr:signal peptidase I [Candidatus Edwardsbacteria bacterium]
MKKKRKPIIAAIFSLFFPGLGQIYNGQIIKGVGFCIFSYVLYLFAVTFLIRSFAGLIITIILTGFYYISVTVDAVVYATKFIDYIVKPYNRWYIYLLYIFITMIMSNILSGFIKAESFKIPNNGMAPTLEQGDYFIVDIKEHKYKRGDVVVHYSPSDKNKILVKRIVAIPKDTVLIIDKSLYINGRIQKEPSVIYEDTISIKAMPLPDISINDYQKAWENSYFETKPYVRDNFGPVIIPDGNYFLLGDNRDNSY